MKRNSILFPNIVGDQRIFLLLDAITPFLKDGSLVLMLTRAKLKSAIGKNYWTIESIMNMRKKMQEVYTNNTNIFVDRDIESLEVLRGKKIITMPEAVRHNLSIEASKNIHVSKIIYNMLSNTKIFNYQSQVFIAFYMGDTDLFRFNIHDFSHNISDFIPFIHKTPFDVQWLKQKPSEVKNALFQLVLLALFQKGVVPISAKECLDAWRQGELDDIPLSGDAALGTLLSGDFSLFAEHCDFLEERYEPFIFLWFRGIFYFLQGDFKNALKDLVDARKKYRSLVGQRSVHLINIYGIAMQFARLAIGTDKELKSLASELKSLEGAVYRHTGVRTLFSLYALYQGNIDMAYKKLNVDDFSPEGHFLSLLLYCLACVHIDNEDTHKELLTACGLLKPYCDLFPCIANMLYTILALKYPPDFIAKYTKEYPEVKCVDLTKVIENKSLWELQVDSLERLFAAEQTLVNSSRLVWLIDIKQQSVQPLEQKISKKGEWSAGRAIALKRLVNKSSSMNWLVPQDSKAIAGIYHETTWYNVEYRVDFDRIIPLLAGHTLLFNAEDRSHISLEEEKIEIYLKEKGDNCILSIPSVRNDGDIIIREKEKNKFVFTLLDKKARELISLFGKKGITFPREFLPRIMTTLSKSANISVNIGVKSKVIAGDTTPILQFQQRGNSFECMVRIRPFKEVPSLCFTPTQGILAPLAHINVQESENSKPTSRSMKAERDLEAERLAVEDILALCPLFAASYEDWLWRGDNIAELLAVLEELHVCTAPYEIEWLEGQKVRVGARVNSSQATISMREKGEWFALEGGVQVNEDRIISISNILDCIEQAQGRFIPIGDGEFLALTDDLKRKLEQLNALAQKNKKGGDRLVHRLSTQSVESAVGDMNFCPDDKWRKSASQMQEAFELQPVLPNTLQAELREYQQEGFEWLCRLAHWKVGACLADDMGLGKTVQTIATMLTLCHEGPCLVIAPTSVCYNWEKEIIRFAPSLNVHRLGGIKDRVAQIKALGAQDVLITGYGLLHNERESLADKYWRMLVFDEAQALKNATTKRAKAGQELNAEFRLALTGTPIENSLDNLWSLFNVINPGLLGTAEKFRSRFGSGESNDIKVLRKLVRPFILRRLKSSVLHELPERTEQTLYIEPSTKEEHFYESLRRKAIENIEDLNKDENRNQNRLHILAELTRLRRACCHASLVSSEAGGLVELVSSKMEYFLARAEELISNGHKLLVFSQFVDHLSLIRQQLEKKGIAFHYLDGSTPEKERRKRVDAFQAGESDVFLISLRAGGQGLNLTAADYVFHLDPWWNHAVEDQASDRAYRIGQTRPVTVYRLVMARSIEEKIIALHKQKRGLVEDFLADTHTAKLTLTEDELLALL